MSAAWSTSKNSSYWPQNTVTDTAKANRELEYWREVEKALGPCFELYGWTGVDCAAFWYIQDQGAGAGGYHKPIVIPGEVANVLVPTTEPAKLCQHGKYETNCWKCGS